MQSDSQVLSSLVPLILESKKHVYTFYIFFKKNGNKKTLKKRNKMMFRRKEN